MKTITKIITLLTLVLAVTLSAGIAAADDSRFGDSLQELTYFASEYGSLEYKDTFDIDTEQPFLYCQFDVDDLVTGTDYFSGTEFASIINASAWHAPSGTYYDIALQHYSVDGETVSYWLGLDSWEDNKELGEWSVSTVFTNTTLLETKVGGASASFTVTPEPVSLLLMGLGGTAIFFRKKQ